MSLAAEPINGNLHQRNHVNHNQQEQHQHRRPSDDRSAVDEQHQQRQHQPAPPLSPAARLTACLRHNGPPPPNGVGRSPSEMVEECSKRSSSSNSAGERTPPSRRGGVGTLSSYVSALRPWSFSASFIPVALGCALAHKATGDFHLLTWAVTCLTAVSVHAAGNVVNTYFDYQKGIDSKRQSDDRTLVDGLLTPDQLVHLGALLYCLGCAGFMLLVALSPARMEHLALVYFGGLSSSFVYTGGIGLKYIGLGEVLVLVIFGPITVLFAYVAQTGSLHPVTLLYAMPLALNTEAILHSNNSRDLEADRRVGIVTLAILLGHTGSHVLFALLLFVPYMVFAVMGLHFTPCLLMPLITLPNAFRLERHFRQGELQALPRLTAKLNVYFGLFYVFACVVAGRGQLPGLTT